MSNVEASSLARSRIEFAGLSRIKLYKKYFQATQKKRKSTADVKKNGTKRAKMDEAVDK